MDVSRGLSLRKKRSVKPKISAPIQQGSGGPKDNASLRSVSADRRRPQLVSNSSGSSQAIPRVRQQASENTADYVKRRYSTRITALPKDFGDVPTLPDVPDQFLSEPPARSAARAGGRDIINEKPQVDRRALDDPNLPVEQYVAKLLANATDGDIKDYQRDLGKIQHQTSTDLQHNVLQNRNQFIKISREAERLKGEMRGLRNLMSDLTNTLGQTNATLGITTDESTTSRKYRNRSSVANLEAMWSTHLQELWRRVEGSQKFLPAIPGRHVLHESGRWVELNTATFKPRRRVHVILLNDHLLIAIEKKRLDPNSPNPDSAKLKTGASTTNQLVTDQCIPLQDVEITDLGSKPENIANRRGSRQTMVNAVGVRYGNDSFTYAAVGSESEKVALLAKFRKAVADLKKFLHIDVDDQVGAVTPRGGLTNSRNGVGNKSPSELPSTDRSSMLVEVDGRQQNFRWVENQVDELDIDIALQRFEDAVEKVEKLRRIAKSNKNNTVVKDLADGKVQERAAKLANAIIRQLVDTNSFINATKKHTGHLIKLGYEARASEAFLEARTNVLKARTRYFISENVIFDPNRLTHLYLPPHAELTKVFDSQCTDNGDLHQYIYQISFIYFTLIQHTVKIYQACFAQPHHSAAVSWAKRHVDELNSLLARQIKALPKSSADRKECMETARAHAGLLNEVGIDFRNLIGRGVEGEKS